MQKFAPSNNDWSTTNKINFALDFGVIATENLLFFLISPFKSMFSRMEISNSFLRWFLRKSLYCYSLVPNNLFFKVENCSFDKKSY